eukprot:3534270-Rhodomonas_salina.3
MVSSPEHRSPGGHRWHWSVSGVIMYSLSEHASHCWLSWLNIPDEVPSVELTSWYPGGQLFKYHTPSSLPASQVPTTSFGQPVFWPEVNEQDPSGQMAATGHALQTSRASQLVK